MHNHHPSALDRLTDVDRMRYELWHAVVRLSNELNRLTSDWWDGDPALQQLHHVTGGVTKLPPSESVPPSR